MRCHDKPKCKKSWHYRGKNRENRGNVAAKIVKIAALSRQIV
jgi:hypothetical protein